MSSWMNEAAAVQNHNGNGFPHMNDPNNIGGPAGGMMDPSAFMANGQFNPAAAAVQYPNPQQMAAAMQNGPMRNASPSFQNPVYQTNPVIPSKRPRPREDSMGASPRQNPGMLPTSRADTPQQAPYPGFQPTAMGPNSSTAQQYPHLYPNGSATASPSPVMAGNQLRPGSVPQRVNTASPHPFSPASQQFGPQASPVPSEHGGTPQPNPYMQNQTVPQGYNPNFQPSPSPARPPSGQNPMPQQMMPQPMGQMSQQMQQMGQMQQMHPSQLAQMQQMQMHQLQQQMQAGGRGMDPKMMQQMRMQAQAQIQQQFNQGRGMMPKQGGPMPNGQMPQGQMHPQQPQLPRSTNPESFMKNLSNFMSIHGLPLDANPSIGGRPLHLLQLFMNMGKFGYYRIVAQRNLWSQVAASVGFHPQQFPSAPAQVKAIYEQNLLKFEAAWMKQRSGNQQMPSPAGAPGGPGQGTPQRMGPQGQMQQGQHIQPGQQPQLQQPHAPTPSKQLGPGMPQPSVNGFSTPQQPQMVHQQSNMAPNHARNSLSRSIEATPVAGDISMPSPSMGVKPGHMAVQPRHTQAEAMPTHGVASVPFPAPPPPSNPDEYEPKSRDMTEHFYGGLDVESLKKLGDELEQWRPNVPPPLELGLIDIHALTKSLQCGILGEVRLALDTLATVTHEGARNQGLLIDLKYCDDLVESLIDCAEEQVDALADGSTPISDEIDLGSYEEVIRLCRVEQLALQRVPVLGDLEYELEHSADRLIAITTILRNLSFFDGNHSILADEQVIKFICGIIRSLGTHENLLRSPKNTLDFMKDIIIFLSNVSGSIELPGREQAFCLLQFLLSFAPTPAPAMSADKVVFPPFEPAIHIYLPNAVDSLAKLLARDEPNRTHYKTIFAADASASPPCELMTRTFALAIAPIPDQNKESRPANLPSFVEARKPIMMQGLLAADIIASLAPGYESGVTRAWLSSGEGFAQNLLRLVRILCNQSEPTQPPTRNARVQQREDTDVLHIITWGVSTLKRLTEKARDPNSPSSIPPNSVPTREGLFDALQMKSPKWSILLNQLCAYAGLD
ncbi:uncharacterized protein BCR38DRAFT_455991 [Pseudomassariella vexata]|uniref:ARID domain-containing protein n=1 Tax=Pseudomassariella vexata TaxID=1141098 RepID=A0A1Y2E6I6_9PEZI|nr:uncharacterized protein BCR38DRAFT_455991 [Pseudomassariella vexata]ORY67142.1 hypothetical protein BCR38DRAFT_455991 [Pseudomassariella vexata]